MMHFADYPDISLRYELSGAGSRSLILIHELAGTSESWDLVTPHLDADFRILGSDQRGAGLSEKVRRPFTAADLVRDIERLVETAGLKPPFHVAGIASGAALAVAFATRHAADMAGLALCSPALKANPERSQYLLSRSETAVKDGMRAIAEMVFARSYQPEVISDRAVYDEYRARFLAIDPVSYAFANRVLAEADQEDALLALSCPVLLLAGAHDLMRPPDYVRSLAARKSNITVDIVDSGHIMVLQAPDEVGRRLSAFFKNCP
jgi:3-oxoadipate enol-lactonase